jgi:hypothetical protein
VIWSKRFFKDAEGAPIQCLGRLVTALGITKRREIVQAGGDLGVPGAKRFFLYAESTAV